MTTLRSFAPVFLALLLLCGGCLKYEKDEYPVELDDIKADEAMGELTRSTSYQQVVAETNIPGRPKHSDSEVISDRSLTVPIKTVDGKKVATIGLVSFLNLVQQNDVQYLRYKETLASAEERLRDSLRSYRPVFGGNISASFDPQNGTESQSVNFSLSQSLPWQGSLRMTSNAQRSHGTSPPDTESMSFSSALSLSFDILLRPGGYMEWKEGIIAAERSWIYAQRSFRQQRESYLINKVREYYDTINSLKTLRTEEDKLKDAQNRLEVAKFEYNRGRKSLTAVYIAEENLIATEQAINDKRENYEEQIDDLKLKLGIPQDYDLELIEEPVKAEVYDLDFEESVRKALAQNPSFQTERDRYEDQRRSFLISLYNLRIAPRISFSYNVPLVDENSEDFENHNSSLTASISWSYNLDQESRKDAYRNLLQSWTIYERDFKRRQDEIVKEVRRQVRAVDNALRSMRNAERSYETSIKKREGAELDYENNNISAAEYNDALNAVTDAWDSLNRARVNYKVEVLRYFSLIGELKIDDRGEWLQ